MNARRPDVDITTLEALDIRVGRVMRAEPFPEARDPAIKLWVDFGEEIGERASSAKLTWRYKPGELVGTLVLGVVNLPPLRVAGFRSEVLVLGVVPPHGEAGDVVLIRPDGGDVIGWRVA